MQTNKALSAVAMVAAMGLLAACGGSGDSDKASGEGDLSGQQLVYVNYGGSSGEAAQKGWLEPFSEETGVQFASDSPPDQAKVKAMVDSGSTTWDIIDFGAATGAAECGVLFDERPDDFDISDVADEYVTDECGVPIFVSMVNVVYNKKLYGDDPPTSATDFMDVEKFPGKRIFVNWADGVAEPLLMTAGVSPDALYPIDWEKVSDAADTLGDEMAPLDTFPAIIEALESGDYGMCLCYGGPMKIAADNGAEFGVIWDKVSLAWDMLYAVKGSKSPEAQWAFLQHVATTEGQAPFYQYSPYATPLKNAPEAPESLRQFLPQYHAEEIQETFMYDPEFWADNMDESIAAWTDIMAG